MKKIYQIPAIGIVEYKFYAALMGSVGDNPQPGQSGTPDKPAPRRRLF